MVAVIDPGRWEREVAASSWADFRALRAGHADAVGRPADESLLSPLFAPGRRSDVLVMNGGYHSSRLPLADYGAMVDRMLHDAVAPASGRRASGALLMLNVPGNTSLVPEMYRDEVLLRSLPFEAARTAAELAAAARSGIAAVDLFSPVLGVHEWAHSDTARAVSGARPRIARSAHSGHSFTFLSSSLFRCTQTRPPPGRWPPRWPTSCWPRWRRRTWRVSGPPGSCELSTFV